MNWKKIRINSLIGLIIVLCVGSIFTNSDSSNSIIKEKEGDTPIYIDSPDSSYITELTGTSSNIGIYQYARGTKGGTYTDSVSNWQIDSGNTNYMRTSSNVLMPVPDGYKLKGLSATVAGLRDYHQFIADKTLNSEDWTILNGTTDPLNPFDITGNEQPYLVENGRKGTGSTEYQNSYFQGQNGISFDIGTYRKTYSGTSTSGWSNAEQWQVNSHPSRSQSSSHYFTSTKSDETGHRDEEYCNPPDSNFGYRDEFDPSINAWDDELFNNNGGVQPDTSSVEKYSMNFPSQPTSGVHDAWAELWSYGSSGYRTPTIDGSTYSRTAVVSVAWDDIFSMYYQIDKELPWTDDGSVPQYASVSFTLTRLNFTSDNSLNWYQTPGDKKLSGNREENKKVEISVILVDPTGSPTTLGIYKFAEGPDYSTGDGYIKDNSDHCYTIPITSYITATLATTPWKLRFRYSIEVHNEGTYTDIASSAASGIGSYAWMTVECNAKSKFGVRLKEVNSTFQDESPWNNGKNENLVCVRSSSIDFGNSTVYRGIDPYFEFDWIIPRGISGPITNPLTGLAYAQPYVMIETHKMVNNAGTWSDQIQRIFINDGETFETVRDRAKPTAFPWLGSGRVWGVDHFNATSSGLGTKLNGVNNIVIYIGFKFTKQFITDWNVQSLMKGGNGNNSLMITNASFAFITNPLPTELGMQLVWDREGAPQESFNILNTAISVGYTTSTATVLQEYMDYETGRQFYFRVLNSSLRCYFTWTITLNITSVTWGTTTTYKISNSGSARFEANFTLNVPTKTGYTTDFKDTWWFDIIFPKYQMQTGGESYWDLIFAYEEAHPIVFKLGEENLGEALADKASKIAVYEDNTDNYRYRDGTPLTGELHAIDEFPYHQFGRFHHEAFAGWVGIGVTSLRWNVLFKCPNYVSNIKISKNSDFSTSDIDYYLNDYCRVKGTYSVLMNQQSPTDIGESTVNWLNPSNEIIDSYYFSSSSIVDQVENSVTTKHQFLTEYPGTEYSAQFIYNDSNVCGDGKTEGDYCHGLYRLGYRFTGFSVRHYSIIDQQTGIFINSTGKASDGVPLIDTRLMQKPFDIIITWCDAANGSPIRDADVKIRIDKWECTSQIKNSVPVTGFNNVDMRQMTNGSYIIHIDPEYKGHRIAPFGPANMTQGFHNYTVTLEKPGYDLVVIQSNFSIIVDTILIINNPQHIQTESDDFTNPVRPNYDNTNAFAGQNYSFEVKLYENLTDQYDSNNLFIDDIGTFYYTKYNVSYQLIGWNDILDKFPINSWEDGQVVSMLWLKDNPSNDIINGSLLAEDEGSIHAGTVNWPKFEDVGSGTYEAAKYVPNIHLYYNITFRIETNRTKYTPNYWWQPNDVRIQTCEDNPIDSNPGNDAIRFSKEEIFGLTLQQENTGNMTFLSLINDPLSDGSAFNMGVYEPNIEGFGQTEDYIINNYWFNVSASKFRFRARLNCTMGAGLVGSPEVSQTPPVGPLNYSNQLYDIIYPWIGSTSISITGWNSSTIEMIQDESYDLWSCVVNKSQDPPSEFTAYGYTYVSPWLYFNQTNAGTKYLTIRSNKEGFVDDTLTVLVKIMNQNTTIYNNTNPTQFFSTELGYNANITTPTGIGTSFVIQFNDTTPANPMFGIENAIIQCVEDDWTGHFTSNPGVTWKWQELSKGRYNITLIDTNLDVLVPTVKNLVFEVTKGNYTTAAFNLKVVITPREMKIICLGGKDVGYYLPTYVNNNWTQLRHIQLTYAILDLDNDSASIDFSSDIIMNYFKFKQADGITFFVTSVNKFLNGTGETNYNVTIKTNIGMEFNVYSKSLTVNFSIESITNYYSTFNIKGITINAVNSSIQMRSPASGIQTARYLWNSSSEWITNCPIYEFNVTDIVHNSFLGRNIPIALGDILLYSNWTNPNKNGPYSINYGAINEDIYYRTRSAIDGYGLSYQYLQIFVDHRGFDVNLTGISFNVSIKIKNYLDATVNLNLIIINATTNIENNRVEYAIYDSDDLPYNPSVTFGGFYSNISAPPSNILTVPWGMTLAVKCRYNSGSYVIMSDIEFDDLVGCGMLGLSEPELFPASVNPSSYEKQGSGEFYFWFKADLKTDETINKVFKILLWKSNFDLAEYTINYTVRARFTEIINESPNEIDVPWSDVATFSFKYTDLDNNDGGITDAIINGTDHGFSGPIFDFGNGLTSSWSFIEQITGNGRYLIRVNTSLLEVRETPYIFKFNVTRLGTDGMIHWAPVVFALNIQVEPTQIYIDHWFVKGDSPPIGLKNVIDDPYGFAFSVNTEDFKNMSIYLRIYTIVDGAPNYIIEDSEITIHMRFYDWNDHLGLTDETNRLTYANFEYSNSLGYWVARLDFYFLNNPDLVLLGYPSYVRFEGSTGIVINATSENQNYEDSSSKWFATIEAPDVLPNAPQSLTAIAGDSKIVLYWEAPIINGGTPIIGYNIYRGSASGEEELVTSVGNVLTFTDTNLINGQVYFYIISAVNELGEGLISNEVTATPEIAIEKIIIFISMIGGILGVLVPFTIVKMRKKRSPIELVNVPGASYSETQNENSSNSNININKINTDKKQDFNPNENNNDLSANNKIDENSKSNSDSSEKTTNENANNN